MGRACAIGVHTSFPVFACREVHRQEKESNTERNSKKQNEKRSSTRSSTEPSLRPLFGAGMGFPLVSPVPSAAASGDPPQKLKLEGTGLALQSILSLSHHADLGFARAYVWTHDL